MASRLVNKLKEDLQALKACFVTFSARSMLTHAAALSYYMVFSFPPMLFIVLWIAARFYKEVAMRRALTGELGELVGSDGARQLMATIEGLDLREPTWWASAVGVGAMLFTATTVMRRALTGELGDLVGSDGARQLMATIEGLDLREPTWWASAVGVGAMLFTATTVLVTARNALNRLADAGAAGTGQGGLWKMLRERVVSFAMLATISFILLVSLVLDALIASLGNLVAEWHGGLASVLTAFDAVLLDVGATTVLIALFIRFLPDTAPPWRDIWAGSFLSAVVLAAGQNAIGALVGRSNAADLYAAAGSVLVLMLWVYYASAIFLFGAAFAFSRAARRKGEQSGADAGDHDRDPGQRPDPA
jgi:membrane protein